MAVFHIVYTSYQILLSYLYYLNKVYSILINSLHVSYSIFLGKPNKNTVKIQLVAERHNILTICCRKMIHLDSTRVFTMAVFHIVYTSYQILLISYLCYLDKVYSILINSLHVSYSISLEKPNKNTVKIQLVAERHNILTTCCRKTIHLDSTRVFTMAVFHIVYTSYQILLISYLYYLDKVYQYSILINSLHVSYSISLEKPNKNTVKIQLVAERHNILTTCCQKTIQAIRFY